MGVAIKIDRIRIVVILLPIAFIGVEGIKRVFIELYFKLYFIVILQK